MSDQTYLFIDGEYLRQRHRQAMQEFFGLDGELDVEPIKRQTGAQRAYFYDSLDDSPRPGESSEACKARTAPLERFFNEVRDLSGFHVRLGSVSSGKKRQQKEVDILLAVDMLTHGFDRNMSHAVLVAGDLDFRPIVEALVRRGVFVQVWYHASSIAQELPYAADFGRKVQFRQIYSWNTEAFRDAHQIPSDDARNGHRAGELQKTGFIGPYPGELYKIPLNEFTMRFDLWVGEDRVGCRYLWDTDLNLLERYAAIQYGPIVWDPTDQIVSG
jgi:uncharacterized LabA/DUF88 family protein